MSEYNTPYVDYGCLWEAPSEGFRGKIYGFSVAVEANGAKATDASPDWWIWDPSDRKNSIGALWDRTSNKGVAWLAGSITSAGEKRPVGLWPATRRSDASPVWRVMPPREPQPKVAGTEEPDIDPDIPF